MSEVHVAAYASPEIEALYRQRCQSRLGALRNQRDGSWLPHWRALAEVFSPRRIRWLISPGDRRGSMINATMVDETGAIAIRVMAAGMMGGLTSPSRMWFRLGLRDRSDIPFGPVKIWLSEVEKRMARVMAESNIYDSLAQLYYDTGIFGSSPMIIYEDPRDIVRAYIPMIGEYFYAVDARGTVGSLYREFTMTVDQIVTEFELENCSTNIQEAWKRGGAQRELEKVICHAIEPNTRTFKDDGNPAPYIVPSQFPYRECYWEQNTADTETFLRCQPFNEKPFIGGRWDVQGMDAYGRSPGMDAYPAVAQLQIMQRRKAEAIEKLVRPPMVGSVSMRNEPKSILPGGISYVSDVQGAGFKPAFQVQPQLQEMDASIGEVQNRVKTICFNDLFLMISQLDTVRTATEIDARKEEKLIELGPVIERWMNEVLDPMIDRIFSIMQRRGMLPDPPEELHGADIDVQYISPLAESQRVSSTLSTERVLAMAGNLMAVDREALDNFDVDYLLKKYGDDLYIDPKGVRSDQQIAAIRKARAQAQQQQQQQEQALAAVQGAKVLSDTNVGGGQSALQAMMQ